MRTKHYLRLNNAKTAKNGVELRGSGGRLFQLN